MSTERLCFVLMRRTLHPRTEPLSVHDTAADALAEIGRLVEQWCRDESVHREACAAYYFVPVVRSS